VVEGAPCVEDRAPPRAPAEVGEQRALDTGHVVDGGAGGPQRVEAHHDAGGAEAALAGARRAERVGPPARARPEPVDGRDGAPSDAASRGDARDARFTVDEHRAATALPLRAAPVLRSAHAETVAQHLQQRRAVVDDLHGAAVDVEAEVTVDRHQADDRFARCTTRSHGARSWPAPRPRSRWLRAAAAARRSPTSRW